MMGLIRAPQRGPAMLTNVEKMKLERAFGMASGYVLNAINLSSFPLVFQ
jgi:hypothetical protein